MMFHLLGGVTPDEAEAVQAEHAHRWTRCGKTGCTTPTPVISVVLMRGPSKRYGDVRGSPCCASHDEELLEMIKGSDGYQGAEIVVGDAVPRG